MSLLFDKLVKGPVFGCQQCGQCLLSQTSYICPMTCPKGLRNGPCGGTLDGACEVLPDRPCVWVNIQQKGYDTEGLHSPFDSSLTGSSSFVNFLSGRDKETRLIHDFTRPKQVKMSKPSMLASRLQGRELALTYEIASPRTTAGLDKVANTAELMLGHIDAINTTTNAGGVPSLHSLETARVVAEAGVPPVVQFCGRDQGPEEFENQVAAALEDGFANVLVLTGDWNPGTERELNPGHWFPMDSLQMVDIINRQDNYPKRSFIGVASNAYTAPMSVSLTRIQSKLAAGAHFTQTQVVTETDIFSRWLKAIRDSEAGRACKILVSIPLVGKQKPWEILKHLPGVYISSQFGSSMEGSRELAKTGFQLARELIHDLSQLDIDGFHLMNFGVEVEAVVELVEEVRSDTKRSAS
jgi:5,10-methylenetetrahydrofolate reductase